VVERRCGECGSLVPDTAKQCMRCGVRLFAPKQKEQAINDLSFHRFRFLV